MIPITRRRLLTAAIGGLTGAPLYGGSRLLKPDRTQSHRALPTDGLPQTNGVPPSDARSSPALVPIVRTGQALGTSVSLTMIHDDAAAAHRAADAAFAAIERAEASLSIYRPDSELSQLNRTGELASAGEDFLAVLAEALAVSRRSRGAFDVSVQPLWAVYSEASRRGETPSEAALAAARSKVNWQAISVTGTRVRLGRPGMSLTFNGIAQGYATDCARLVLASHGIRQALVDVGELGAIGDKGPGEPWRTGIQHPRQENAFIDVAALDGRSLATSGDYATRFATPGGNDHHILNPQTGHSPHEFSSVSVVAPTAMQADALSTALFVLGAERGRALIAATPGVDVLFVRPDRSVLKTAGFPSDDRA